MRCEMGNCINDPSCHCMEVRCDVASHHWHLGVLWRFSVWDDLTDSTYVENVPAQNPMKVWIYLDRRTVFVLLGAWACRTCLFCTFCQSRASFQSSKTTKNAFANMCFAMRERVVGKGQSRRALFHLLFSHIPGWPSMFLLGRGPFYIFHPKEHSMLALNFLPTRKFSKWVSLCPRLWATRAMVGELNPSFRGSFTFSVGGWRRGFPKNRYAGGVDDEERKVKVVGGYGWVWHDYRGCS